MTRRIVPPAGSTSLSRSALEQRRIDLQAEAVEQWNRTFGPVQRYELGDLVLTVGQRPADQAPWITLEDTEVEAEVMLLGHEALDLLREALDRIHPPF